MERHYAPVAGSYVIDQSADFKADFVGGECLVDDDKYWGGSFWYAFDCFLVDFTADGGGNVIEIGCVADFESIDVIDVLDGEVVGYGGGVKEYIIGALDGLEGDRAQG